MHQQAVNTGIEIVDRDACEVLLRSDEIGRLAILDGGRPLILPVNYVVDEGDIVFRTGPGTKLEQGPRAPACFEIDHFDRAHRAGWSVVVTGRLEEVTSFSHALFEHTSGLAVHPWAAGPKDHVMRLVPSSITGRRIRGT